MLRAHAPPAGVGRPAGDGDGDGDGVAEAGGDGTRTVAIVRADDGSVGLRFLRRGDANAGPFRVASLVPQSAAEQSGVVKAGDHFRAVDGHDVTTLDDAAVAALFRGAPRTRCTLVLCDGPPPAAAPPPPPASALDDKEVAAALQWASSKRLPASALPEFEELLRLLQPVSIPPAAVSAAPARPLQRARPPPAAAALQLLPADWQRAGLLCVGVARTGHRTRSQWQRDEGRAAGLRGRHQARQPQRAEASAPTVSLPLCCPPRSCGGGANCSCWQVSRDALGAPGHRRGLAAQTSQHRRLPGRSRQVPRCQPARRRVADRARV